VKFGNEIEEGLLRCSGGCDDAAGHYRHAQSVDQCVGDCKLLLQLLHQSIGFGYAVFRDP